MTNQEAIEQLKFDMAMILFNPDTGEELTPEQVKFKNEDNYKTYIADQMAIAALEKQEPALIQYGKCPICRNWLKEDMAFCDKCGQAVKWR